MGVCWLGGACVCECVQVCACVYAYACVKILRVCECVFVCVCMCVFVGAHTNDHLSALLIISSEKKVLCLKITAPLIISSDGLRNPPLALFTPAVVCCGSYTHILQHTHTQAGPSTTAHTHTYTHTYTHTQTGPSTTAHTHTHTYIHTCIHTKTHKQTHTCTHTPDCRVD